MQKTAHKCDHSQHQVILSQQWSKTPHWNAFLLIASWLHPALQATRQWRDSSTLPPTLFGEENSCCCCHCYQAFYGNFSNFASANRLSGIFGRKFTFKQGGQEKSGKPCKYSPVCLLHYLLFSP